MKGRNYSLLPGELKDCLLHCGFCKKQDIFQNFLKNKKDGFYKCPNWIVSNLVRNFVPEKSHKSIMLR